MKTLKSIFAVSLFIVGLSLTSCSSDDKFIEPAPPIAPPIEAEVQNPIYDYDMDHPIERPEIENPVIPEPVNPIEQIPSNPIEPGKEPR
ncbi:hypothetical protein [Carboxylicivirga sp. RSCT41]|uniref:hypothetical protein n=1 Tax=Carboxylicivirga agarovorans TaxID=3417570 RepID=UPI003D328A4A